jgi:hypothetical protein
MYAVATESPRHTHASGVAEWRSQHSRSDTRTVWVATYLRTPKARPAKARACSPVAYVLGTLFATLGGLIGRVGVRHG